MNTSGFIRGYMWKNMTPEKFIEVVTKALSKEFEKQVELEKNDGRFKISMGEYRLTLSRRFIEKAKGPYSLDCYILDEFRKQGFNFDENRSQYIQYCYGNYEKAAAVISLKDFREEKALKIVGNKEGGYVEVNGTKIAGFKDYGICSICGEKRYYSQEYDVYYCAFCDKWLEKQCGDPHCEFCSTRPKRPSNLWKSK